MKIVMTLLGVRYIFEMILHKLLSALWPAAHWLIVICGVPFGGGPFKKSVTPSKMMILVYYNQPHYI